MYVQRKVVMYNDRRLRRPRHTTAVAAAKMRVYEFDGDLRDGRTDVDGDLMPFARTRRIAYATLSKTGENTRNSKYTPSTEYFLTVVLCRF